MTSKKTDMPSNITNIAQRRAKKNQAKDDLFDLLSRIDELEDALEIMDEHGVTTREELESHIAELERRAAELDEET
jgi:uncharacterized protein YlxW (UPF0749 family)